VGAAVVEGAGHTRLEVLRVHLPVAPDAHGEAGGDRVGGRRADAIGAGAGGVAVEVRPRHRGAEGLDDAVDPGVGVVVDGQTAPVVDDLDAGIVVDRHPCLGGEAAGDLVERVVDGLAGGGGFDVTAEVHGRPKPDVLHRCEGRHIC